MKKMESIVAHPYHWDEGDTEERKVRILLWALTRDSASILVCIEDFPASFIIELPVYVNNRPFQWNKSRAGVIFRLLRNFVSERSQREQERKHALPKLGSLLGFKFEKRWKLYYYREYKYPMMTIYFENKETMYKCKDFLQNPVEVPGLGLMNLRAWDHDVTCVRKLLTHLEMKYSQWFKLEAVQVDPNYSISKLPEYSVSFRDITPISYDTSRSWITYPKLLSFDIECYSPNPRSFPNQLLRDHDVFIITAMFQRLSKPETRRNFCLVIGECEEVKNVEMRHVDDEISLIRSFEELIEELDPDIITGYNIHEFDDLYIWERLQRRALEFTTRSSRLHDVKPSFINRPWKSSGYGHQNLAIIIFPGRISIDMLTFVRRTERMRYYDLDTVGKHFLGRGKNEVSPQEIFKAYKLYKASKRNSKYEEAAFREMSKVVKYAIQDASIVLDLFDLLNLWFSLVEFSNISGCRIADYLTHGEQMKCSSQIWDFGTRRDFLINRRAQTKYKIKGATVLTPMTGVHPIVLTFDFTSMYPTIMIAHNICFSTLLPPEGGKNVEYTSIETTEADHDGEPDEEDEELIPDEDEEDSKQSKQKENTFNWVKRDVRIGLLASILEELMAERKRTKEMMKEEKDSVQKSLLNARQNAQKIGCNSHYGVLGFQGERSLTLPEGAMSVTAMGRYYINFIKDYLSKKYRAKVIYGDTDSCMVDFGFKDVREAFRAGPILAKELTDLCPKPMAMELEKIIKIFPLKAKNYAYYLYDKETLCLKDSELLSKGIALVRRDGFQWFTDTYLWCLEACLHEAPILEVFDYIVDRVSMLVRGQIPWNQFEIVKGLGSDYKNPNFCMNVFAQELAASGVKVTPGDRLRFVIVITEEERRGEDMLLGKKMRIVERYIENPEPIDYAYYLGHLVAKRLDYLFFTKYRRELRFYSNFGFKAPRKRKEITVAEPVRMMASMHLCGEDVLEAKKIIRGRDLPSFPVVYI